jgi:hypothetical protein
MHQPIEEAGPSGLPYFRKGGEDMKRTAMLFVVALMLVVMAVVTASAGFAAQPQSGQPGLTEGKNGPPPFPHH